MHPSTCAEIVRGGDGYVIIRLIIAQTQTSSVGENAMLQPKSYPRLLGQALTLEPAPFVEMVDDDNPWIEGLFFVFVLGVLIGVARLVGGLLLSASLPAPDAVLEAIVASLKQAFPVYGSGQTSAEAAELFIRQSWAWITPLFNYGSGWVRLLMLVMTPLALIGQWLLYTIISHAAARLLGGRGTLGQTMGALALSIGPRVLLVATIMPFASVSPLLMHSWGILIAYRGLEVAHDLSPGKAAAAALIPTVFGIFFFLLALVLGSGFLTLMGGGA
jgi:hypothetical protein